MRERQGLGALLPHEVWNALLAGGAATRFEPGALLMRQGDPGTFVLLLTSGLIKVWRVDPQGEELLLAVRGPGEVVGDFAVLDGTVRTASVTAMRPCITYVLPAERFRRIVGEHGLEHILMRHIIARIREGEDWRAEMAELPARELVTRILLRLAAAVDGPSPLLDLSQEDIANAAGLSRSAVAAELANLRQQGLLTTGRRRLVIHDVERLRAMLE